MTGSNSGEGLPVAIVGAGFSGTLLAINLARQGASVVLVERDDAQLAKGLAFGTRRPEHLLNVRAANMSAYPDDAGHFLRWMGYAGADQANRFVPRLAYGQYLREQLLAALAAHGGRVRVHSGEAVGAEFSAGSARLVMRRGAPLECRAIVLALGNLPPPEHPLLGRLPPAVYSPNPWVEAPDARPDGAGHVLLLGTGLTAVDTILSLDAAGFTGRFTALSRRGLQPRAHARLGPVVNVVARPVHNGAGLLHTVRARAAEVGWRAAVDELRFHTQALWRRHDPAAQARFLRHLRPYWDVHRHRLAPPVAERIAALEASGRLAFRAGKLIGADPAERGAVLRWRPRGTERVDQAEVDRIINCTGPEADITRTAEPLLRGLLAAGAARPDPHRLGLDVDHACRVRTASGKTHDRLLAVGPLTRGEAWEIIAVPDIRRQVWDLARRLTATHWVEGEGL